MKNKILLLILSLALCFGCKKDNSVVTNNEQQKKIKVTLTAIIKTDDDFQLFYKEEDNVQNPFEESNSLWTKVKGSDKSQNIEFILPENILPNYFRLDIGKNEKQQGITISGMKIEFLDKKIEINSKDFIENYFVHNSSVEIKDNSTGEVVTKKNESGLYDPVFNSGENLKFELQKMYK